MVCPDWMSGSVRNLAYASLTYPMIVHGRKMFESGLETRKLLRRIRRYAVFAVVYIVSDGLNTLFVALNTNYVSYVRYFFHNTNF